MTTELKLCKDCKHYRNLNEPIGSKCVRVPSKDIVEGTLTFCRYARLEYKPCSPLGLLFEPIKTFEPKLSLWYKLKNIFRKP